MRTSALALAAAAAGALIATARPCAANGRYPASTQIAFAPGSARVVVRATFGVLFSQPPVADGGVAWRWLCEGALGIPAVAVEDPTLGLTAGGALVVGLNEGLDVSTDDGCHFTCAGADLAPSFVDVAVRPDAPHAVVALSSTFVTGDAAGPTSDSRVFESTDDGAHWTSLGVPLDPTVLVTTIDVAATDPDRLYVSGTRGFGAARTAALFVSTDRGAHWVERPVPFDAARESAVYIGAVDPVDADRVYVRSTGAAHLYVTGDAGRTFDVPLAFTGPMQGLAVSPDGAKVYAGSESDGLYVGARGVDGGLAFQKTSSLAVMCLATRGPELWACTDDRNAGFAAGVSTDDGAHFEGRLRLQDIAGPVVCSGGGPSACNADGGGAQCTGPAFGSLCALVGCDADAGAGSTDQPMPTLRPTIDASASSVPTGAAPAASSSSCGCAVVGQNSAAAAGALGTFACAAAFLVRRRRGARRRND